MKYDRIIASVLCLILVFSLGACNVKNPTGSIVDNDVSSSSDVGSSTEEFDIVLNIDNNADNVVNTDFAGLSGIYHYFSFGGDNDGVEKYTPEQLKFEIDNLKKTGVRTVRTAFNEEMPYEPDTKTLDWDSEDMQPFYDYLDAMTEAGIDVGVNFSWTLNALGGTDVARRNLAVFKDWAGTDDFEELLPYYAKFYSEFVKEVIVKRGFSCVKYAFLFTETNNVAFPGAEAQTKDVFYKWLAAVKALDSQLKKDGVRKNILLVGPNTTENCLDFLKWTVEEADDYIDIYACHKYTNVSNWYDTGSYYQVKMYAEEMVNIVKSTGKPFWQDENNAILSGHTTDGVESANLEYNDFTANHPLKGTQLATNIITNLNSGVDGWFLWTLASQKYAGQFDTNYDSFVEGVQYLGVLPYLYKSNIPKYAWYAYSLMGSALKHPEQKVYKVKGSPDFNAVLTESSDGTKTLIAVNTDITEKTVSYNFEKMFESETVYRYVYDPAKVTPTNQAEPIGVSGVYEKVTDSFNDTIPVNAVVVYTTTKLYS